MYLLIFYLVLLYTTNDYNKKNVFVVPNAGLNIMCPEGSSQKNSGLGNIAVLLQVKVSVWCLCQCKRFQGEMRKGGQPEKNGLIVL